MILSFCHLQPQIFGLIELKSKTGCGACRRRRISGRSRGYSFNRRYHDWNL